MNDHEAVVQEYLRVVLPLCWRTPQPVTDRYGNILPPDQHEFSLKMGMRDTANGVWTFVDPQASKSAEGMLFEYWISRGFRSYVNGLMLFKGRTFDEAVAEATEIVREAVRRYYDGSFDEWYRSLYTEEDDRRWSEAAKRHYAGPEGQSSEKDRRSDLPFG